MGGLRFTPRHQHNNLCHTHLKISTIFCTFSGAWLSVPQRPEQAEGENEEGTDPLELGSHSVTEELQDVEGPSRSHQKTAAKSGRREGQGGVQPTGDN